MHTIFDIETASGNPPQTVIDILEKKLVDKANKALLEVKADGRMTDPIKIQADLSRKRGDIQAGLDLDKILMRQAFPLHWSTGQISAIGLRSEDSTTIFYQCDQYTEEDILNFFWKYMHDHPKEVLVGYNSKAFDIPFIYGRSAILRVKPTVPIVMRKYWRNGDNHWDLYESLGEKSLSYWCAAFGIPNDDTSSGFECPQMFVDKNYQGIVKHLEYDLEKTDKLALAIKDFPR